MGAGVRVGGVTLAEGVRVGGSPWVHSLAHHMEERADRGRASSSNTVSSSQSGSQSVRSGSQSVFLFNIPRVTRRLNFAAAGEKKDKEVLKNAQS